MAVKIRCSECRKKISVDEAFAGSMCRCPYCKSIVMVPKLDTAVGGAVESRPLRPGERPVTPGGRPAAPGARASTGGTGLKNVTGSRPMISTPTNEPHKHTGPTRIERAGVPQVPGEPKTPQKTPPKSPKTSVEGKPASPLSQRIAQGKIEADKAVAKRQAAKEQPEEEVVIETVAVDTSELSDEQIAAIPTANPIYFQGMVSLVLILILLVMIAGCAILGYKMFANQKPTNEINRIYKDGEPAVEEKVANPFLVNAKAASVCNSTPIEGPVVYCIDAGAKAKMGDMYTYSKDLVRASILSLKPSDKFGVLVAQDGKVNVLTPTLQAGGEAGEEAIRETMLEEYDGGKVFVGGASDLSATISRALAFKPKTIVLVVSRKHIPQTQKLGQLLTKTGTRLVFVALGLDSQAQKEDYNAVVKAAGGKSVLRLYESSGEIDDWYEENELP